MEFGLIKSWFRRCPLWPNVVLPRWP